MTDPFDIDALRERLRGPGGEAAWRSLDELADSDAFREHLYREFPEGAAEWDDPAGRRRFLKLMGASLALAGVGLAGCGGESRDQILPYVEAPEEVIPGRPLFFATAFPFAGYAQGVLVESHMGRPTKIEGNPDHPASLGSTHTFAQASVLDLYDPARSTNVRYRGGISTWQDFVSAVQGRRRRWQQDGGAGLRLLTGTVTSPTLTQQLDALLDALPAARWHTFDPLARDHEQVGLRRAFGTSRRPVYHLDRAEVVCSLDSDFLYERPGSVRYARDFARRRRVREGRTAMNRLYMAESSVSVTGAAADHRLPLAPSRIERLAQALADALAVGEAPPPALPDDVAAWVEALADDLRAHAGRSLVVAGETMPPAVHALVHRLNDALGNVGATVEYIAPPEARPGHSAESLRALVRDMAAGRVETLVVLEANPVYTAPADLPFGEALARVPTTIHLGTHLDETGTRALWHVPATHYLEAWSDLRAYDGTVSIQQPLIAPLYEPCRSAHELLAVLAGTPRRGYPIVREAWAARFGAEADALWQQSLRDGVVPGTRFGRVEREVSVGAVPFERLGPRPADRAQTKSTAPDPSAAALPAMGEAVAEGVTAPIEARSTVHDTRLPDTPPPENEGATGSAESLEVVFRPDPSLWDGRYATNAWLQELPRPLTKLCWDNAVLMSPAEAARRGLVNEQVVRMRYRGRTLEGPVWMVPGHPDGTVTLFLGHGRPQVRFDGGAVDARLEEPGAGFDAYALRTSEAPWAGRGLVLEALDERRELVTTQNHHSMEGRELVRAATVERFREHPAFVHEGEMHELPSLYPAFEYPDLKWGMVIDLTTCIGCNACIVACQAENNIPVVGKEEVRRGREMHWLRVDRYYKGDLDSPQVFFQPLPCMHCEKAPCEVVCPVYATVHDHQGLNVMVYNRCIGTRYCSNNCPYKVRRFNFLQYADWETESLKNQRNPDVTVRSRGVMEKCTYCIQRIRAGTIRAQNEGRALEDGEVMTACQMACPTEAIVFGDLNDETSAVHAWHRQPHNYALLHHLGTRPRTTYLARLRNPNPDVPPVHPAGFAIGQDEEPEGEVGDDRDEP